MYIIGCKHAGQIARNSPASAAHPTSSSHVTYRAANIVMTPSSPVLVTAAYSTTTARGRLGTGVPRIDAQYPITAELVQNPVTT